MKYEGAVMEALYYRTHQQLFNQPYVEDGAEATMVAAPCDLRTAALRMFRELHFDDFITRTTQACPDWEKSHDALHLIGTGHFYAKRHAEAEEHLVRALELRQELGKPSAADTLVVMGEVSRDLGHTEGAWQYLNAAHAVAPHHTGVIVNRFCLASLARNKEQLEAVYESTKASYPNWYNNKVLCTRLSQDGELFYLRSTPVWSTMMQKMQSA